MSATEQQLSNPNGACVGPQSADAGRASSCAGCPNAQICASGAGRAPVEDPDLPAMRERLSSIAFKVLVLSGKGGVGKSTMTKELGFALGRKGLLTGLLDADICGPSLPRLTGVVAEELHNSADGWEPVSVDDNVTLVSMHFLMGENKDDAVVWRGPRKNGMIKNFFRSVSWGNLDVLLIDTPPGTSDEHISLISFLTQCGGVDGAIVVTTPQEVAMADVRREVTFCQKTKVPVIGFVENMSGFVCPNCSKASSVFPSQRSKGAGETLSEEYGYPLLGKVPLDPRLMQSCEDGVALSDVAPESPAVIALNAVAEKVVAALKARRG